MSICGIMGRIRKLISQGWVADGPAKSADGRRVEARSIEATSWSLFGAMAAAAAPFSAAWLRCLERLLEAAGEIKPVRLLDWSEDPGRTQRDILAVVDKAMRDFGQ